MTDSVLTHDHKKATTTRVDDAHGVLSTAPAQDENWLAMAGRDPQAGAAQMDRQTSELIQYVQQQNDEIDSRQSELNAKLAQLDHELRTARLLSTQREGADLLPDMESLGSGGDQLASSTPSPTSTARSEQAKGPSLKEFEEVERLVAGRSPESNVKADKVHQSGQRFARSAASIHGGIEGARAAVESHKAMPESDRRHRLEDLDAGSDIQAMATSLDAGALESEKRLLSERKIELDRRRSVLQRMQDEAQALHREALEMRLVTEQVWAELSDKVPSDHLNELLGSLRSRLDDHYATMNNTLQERRDDLIALKQHLQEKQLELRGQSQKLQEWVESRHDEIKGLAAQLDAREMLLDRREHRLQEEFSKWEAQRSGYQQQLQDLMRKVNLAGLNESGV